jgi:hypothetical protein
MSEPIRINETPRGTVWSQRVSLEEADGSFDLAFWQAQSAEARFTAAWEMVETAWEIKNRPTDELRLQRSVGQFVPFPS